MFSILKEIKATITLLIVFSIIVISFSEGFTAKAETRTIVVPDDYFTITTAIGNASEGDTIFVKKGIYEEYSLLINKTLALVGEDANRTIIKNIDESHWDPVNPFPPPSPVAVQISANNVKVSGFTITFEYGWWYQ